MIRAIRFITLAALALCVSGPAFAQATYPTVSGSRVQGIVPLQCDTSGANCTVAGDPAAPAAGAAQVQGNVASGRLDDGNPVKVGGVVNTSLPSVGTTGQRKDLWLGQSGAAIVGGVYATATDGLPRNVTYLTGHSGGNGPLISAPYLYNGLTQDQQRGNTDTAALVTLTAAAPTTTNSADQTNYNGRGLNLYVNISAIATQTVVVNLQVKDPVSGTYFTVLSSATLASVASTRLVLYPGVTPAANLASSDLLPRTWRVQVVGSVGGTVSMTVSASVIL